MNRKQVLAILNNNKVTVGNLRYIINKSNIKIRNLHKIKKKDLVILIMKKHKLNKQNIIFFYTIPRLKNLLSKYNIKVNLGGKTINAKRKTLFDIYIRLKNRTLKNNFETYSDRKQGRREYMEDSLAHFQNNLFHYSAVFDGHGGDKCSLFLKRNLLQYIKRCLSKNKNIKQSLVNAYDLANKFFLNLNIDSGSTCNVLYINKKNKQFYLANLGDSRAVVCYKDDTVKVLSRDHKPTDKREMKRIYKQGGFVEDKRVDGILAMSRSIGDRKIARHLSSIPSISVGSIKLVKYIIQASDGLYDVMSNKGICKFININLKKGVSKKQIPYLLVKHAIHDRISHDNVSVIITYIS